MLRVYGWSRPTLSFGRHESVRGRFTAEQLERENVGAVRRPTGGRVLMHDREVTYSVTAPAPDDERLKESYRRINAMLIAALARLGVPVVEAATQSAARRPGGAACFAEPSAGELVVGNRKLVGSAQLRESRRAAAARVDTHRRRSAAHRGARDAADHARAPRGDASRRARPRAGVR